MSWPGSTVSIKGLIKPHSLGIIELIR